MEVARTVRTIPTPKVTEAEFQAQVLDLARVFGWRVMHVRRSVGRRNGAAGWQTTTSIKGWPDLFLFHPKQGRHLAAELKADGGKLRPEQVQVLADLELSGVPAYVWRPSDFDDIARLLRGSR